ncbi:hypothetical protein H257_13428 [Aphanomyces astaci]|uniref:Uncharacterized protein n=1 Tax=Aphanomyces astaci TaxID=112090 RepID=W4FWI2_APHAT|nr:hypothetical protein H257_13428 [Aphanomyces astaci]ETV71296.1 hypothetical protein H257_13428 [Aphanomyces astaci]|eukprot:XP_009839236.1 hypothetical protein H257_13428 [Aphanomyces astaci]
MLPAFESWLSTAFPASPPKKGSKGAAARLLKPLHRRPELNQNQTNQTQNQVHLLRRQTASLPALGQTRPPDPKLQQLARFHSLVAECSYESTTPTSSSTTSRTATTSGPRLEFFTALTSVHQQDIGMHMPCTFVCDGAGSFTLLYTVTPTILQVKMYPSTVAVTKDAHRIVNLLSRRNTSDAQTVLACYKVPLGPGNDIHFLHSKLAILQHLETIAHNPTQVAALQEYIQPKGSKAWLVRSVWQPKHPFVWVLTDQNHHFTNTKCMDSCHIDKSTSSSSWPVPKGLTANLVRVLEPTLNVKFQQVVVDLIQNDQGQWWLIQVKAFRCKRATDYLFVNFCVDHFEHEWDHHLTSLHPKDRNRLYNQVLFCDTCYPQYAAQKTPVLCPSVPPLLPTTHTRSPANMQPTTRLQERADNTNALLASLEAALIVPDAIQSPECDQSSQPNDLAATTTVCEPQITTARHCSSMIERKRLLPHDEPHDAALEPSAVPGTGSTTPTVAPQLMATNHTTQLTSPEVVVISALPAPKSASQHLDTLWSKLAPPPLHPQQPPLSTALSSTTSTTSSSSSIVVLPQETVDVDAARIFYDEPYKNQVVSTIRSHFHSMHAVRVACRSPDLATLALHTLFLEIRDECIEGQYGLFNGAFPDNTTSHTFTPYYTMPLCRP